MYQIDISSAPCSVIDRLSAEYLNQFDSYDSKRLLFLRFIIQIPDTSVLNAKQWFLFCGFPICRHAYHVTKSDDMLVILFVLHL